MQYLCSFLYLPLLFVNTIELAVRKGLEEALLKKVIVLQLLAKKQPRAVKKILGTTDLESALYSSVTLVLAGTEWTKKIPHTGDPEGRVSKNS